MRDWGSGHAGCSSPCLEEPTECPNSTCRSSFPTALKTLTFKMAVKAPKDVRAGGRKEGRREERREGREEEEKGQQQQPLGLPSPQPAMRGENIFLITTFNT